MPEIRVKRVYAEPEPEDGRRVLVDRLWPRNVSKDRIDDWLKDLAPSTELRQDFHHGAVDFEGFRDRYRLELEDREGEMEQLLSGREKKVTLLFGSRDENHNNAVVLAEALRDLQE